MKDKKQNNLSKNSITSKNFGEVKKTHFKKSGFTLVELIIVITILAILATIAFLAFGNYTKSTRDASRVATLKNIEKGLFIYEAKNSKYPSYKDGEYTLITGSGIYIKQGRLTSQISQDLGFNEYILDPKDYSGYIYNLSINEKKYQLGTYLEVQDQPYFSLISSVYADINLKNRFLYTIGDNLGVFVDENNDLSSDLNTTQKAVFPNKTILNTGEDFEDKIIQEQAKSGNSLCKIDENCIAKTLDISIYEHNNRSFEFDKFTLLYGNNPIEKKSKDLNIPNGISKLTAKFSLGDDGGLVVTDSNETLTCNAGFYVNGDICKPADIGYYVANIGATEQTKCTNAKKGILSYYSTSGGTSNTCESTCISGISGNDCKTYATTIVSHWDMKTTIKDGSYVAIKDLANQTTKFHLYCLNTGAGQSYISCPTVGYPKIVSNGLEFTKTGYRLSTNKNYFNTENNGLKNAAKGKFVGTNNYAGDITVFISFTPKSTADGILFGDNNVNEFSLNLKDGSIKTIGPGLNLGEFRENTKYQVVMRIENTLEDKDNYKQIGSFFLNSINNKVVTNFNCNKEWCGPDGILRIGSSDINDQDYNIFDGTIHNMIIYNKALSDAEIKNIFSGDF